MDNGYVDGLRQLDSRPRSPVVVPHDISALRKKILFENTLLEERALHEFSAGKGDGAGVDTGSAPLKPLTSPTPSPTPTPTPAPAGIPVASTASVVIGNAGAGNNGTYVKKVPQQVMLDLGFGQLYSNIAGTCYVLGAGNGDGRILFSPDAQAWDDLGLGTPQFGTPFGNWKLGYVYYEGGDSSSWFLTEIATNASTDANYIPTGGWTPSITITAA